MTNGSERAAIEMLAEFLAAHALLLLGIGLVLSALASSRSSLQCDVCQWSLTTLAGGSANRLG